jgi:hypothetical protein
MNSNKEHRNINFCDTIFLILKPKRKIIFLKNEKYSHIERYLTVFSLFLLNYRLIFLGIYIADKISI